MNFVAAILFAVSTSSLLAVVLGFLRGGLDHSSAALALGCGLLVASFTFWQGRTATARARRPSIPEWLAIIAFVLVSARIFLWVVFIDGDDIKVLSANNLGDLPLHLTYVRYLANGVPFWPDNPIFTGGKLSYPVGVDLFHALLVLLGMNVFRGFIWIGIVGAAATGVALWRWGRGIALFGFLANGGLAGFEMFHSAKLADFQTALAWKSIALALFATQRGLLFALPAGLLLLSSWRSRFFRAGEDDWRLPLWGEVLLYASLPLFHIHTFLFLSALLGVWFLFRAPARLGLLGLVGLSFVPATVLVYLITGGLNGGHLIGWKVGWMWDDSGFLEWCQAHWGTDSRWVAGLAFWPLNFGVLPIFVAVLCVRLCLRGSGSWPRLVVFPALGIFLLCCFVKFAPWEWDNTKLMVWSYLAILPFVWSEVIAPLPRWCRSLAGMLGFQMRSNPPESGGVHWSQVLAIFALFFSGFVSTLGGIDASHPGYTIANRSDLDGVAYALRNIPVNERFAGAPTYNHPILLNGRKMVLGYLGHVSSHGLAWQEPSAKLDALMNGEEGWQKFAKELGARYLFWGAPENEAFKDSSQPWRKTARLVATGDWGAIYDLQSPPDKAAGLPELKE